MAKCDYCGKGVTFGIKVSHSHRRSNRAWKPNVKRVKAMCTLVPDASVPIRLSALSDSTSQLTGIVSNDAGFLLSLTIRNKVLCQ